MKAIEKKMRKLVRQAYEEYKECLRYGGDTHYDYSRYQAQMDLLIILFPNSTNQENLERKWDSEYYKNNR